MAATEKPGLITLARLFWYFIDCGLSNEAKSFVFCYLSIISCASKIDAIWFLYIESGSMTSFDNPQSPKHPLNLH